MSQARRSVWRMSTAPTLPSWLTRIGVFDLETTGVDVTRERIVTAHVGVIDAQGQELSSQQWLADPGIEIPAGASAVHGISTATARAQGAPARAVVAEIVQTLRDLFAQQIPIVAYNAAFDFSLLHHEAVRHRVAPLEITSPIIDPHLIDKKFDRYRRGKRTLEAVSEHYSVVLDGAHEASADAIAAGRVALALAQRFELPECVHELHTAQIGWAREQAASLTEYFIKVGRLEAGETLDGTWPVRQHSAPAM